MEFLNKIILGDVREKLKLLPDNSVRCVVTSPPYFNQRDYGTGKWIGGDIDCDHKPGSTKENRGILSSTLGGGKEHTGHKQEGYKSICGRCGAKRVDMQVGLEDTPEQYVATIVSICEEVKRVLMEDGTMWLNLGDSYCSTAPGTMGDPIHIKEVKEETAATKQKRRPKTPEGLKPKDLIGIPWMVAFALRAAGWYLRCDIIWNKKNCMPESVTDRPTKNHEYLFLFSKSPKYYYDHNSIKTHLAESTLNDTRMYKEDYENKRPDRDFTGSSSQGSGLIKRKADKRRGHSRRHAGFNERWDSMTKQAQQAQQADGANKRSVWTAEDNYDIWEWLFSNAPSDVVLPLWEKYVSDESNKQSVWTLATKPFSEAHFATFPPDLIIDCIKAGSEEGDIVLDPFMGAGTMATVSQKLNRNFIGIELNPKYIAIAEKRLRDELGMFLVEHKKMHKE